MNHIVYINCRATDLTPYYVGAGKTSRTQVSRIKTYPRRKAEHDLHGTVTKIIASNLSKEDAHDFEELLIAEYRRHGAPLVNISSGGRSGTKGVKRHHSIDTRAKLSSARATRIVKDSTREKHRQNALGNKYAVGNTLTAEHRNAIRSAQLGNIHGLGHQHREETKARISEAMKKPKSPETIERMRLAQQKRFANHRSA